MKRTTKEFFLGWAVTLVALGFIGSAATKVPAASPLRAYTYASSIDTVTYADKRIVYTVDIDTATNADSQLIYRLDLSSAPEVVRGYYLIKPDFDSAMIITGDTFAMSPTDSATATARAAAWGVTDPYTVTLAWHTPNPPAPDPVTGFTLAMVYDTLQANWTETADSYQVYGGLTSGPGADYTDTVAAGPNKHQVTTFGSYWTCIRAFSGADISDQRCPASVTYVDTTSANDSFPNEPAGHTLISSRVFSAYLEDGWTNLGTNNYIVPVVDATAPISPSNVGRARFPAGFTQGVAPMNTYRIFTATDSLYIAFPLKVSANWQGQLSGGGKVLFIGASDYGGGGDPVYLFLQGVGANPLNLQVRLQGPGTEKSLGTGSGNLGGNAGDATFTRDVWYTIEILFVANTSTNFDGEVHVWMNGTKTHAYTDIMYFDDAADASAHKFTVVKWNPTWGGTTPDTVDAEMSQFIDHFRISGP